jgi:hypothetical protein
MDKAMRMSHKEAKRYATVQQVMDNTLEQSQAAPRLG